MSEPTDTHTGQRIVQSIVRVIGYLIYAYLIFVEIILFLGFFLLLFGANPSSGFVEWVYRSLDRAMRPFRGIFEPIELGTTGNDVPAVFDTSIIFAMIIYGIVALLLKAGLDWLTERINRIDHENRLRAQQAEYQEAANAPHYTTQQAPTGPDTSRAVPGSGTTAPTSSGTAPASGTSSSADTTPPPPPPRPSS
ncbi:MAG: hypothetical protein ACR2O6_09500 [Ilumatobacteraceae bacterium]